MLDHARRRSSTELVIEPDPERPADGDFVDTLTARAALMEALAGLPPRQRACVVLRYFEDLSVADTATALGCSQGNVKSQTSRALFSLRSRFEDSPFGELAEGAVSW